MDPHTPDNHHLKRPSSASPDAPRPAPYLRLEHKTSAQATTRRRDLDLINRREHDKLLDSKLLHGADDKSARRLLAEFELAILLCWITSASPEHLVQIGRCVDDKELFLKKHPDLAVLLQNAWSAAYLQVQSPPRPSIEDSSSMLPAFSSVNGCSTTLKSWDHPFVGNAHQLLWKHICKYVPAPSGMYAPYCTIVQSSGMGKSRCVDELSKLHFVVPLNLRNPAAQGFPASDKVLFDFFKTDCNGSDSTRIFALMNAFMISLFEILEATVNLHNPEPEQLASWFRNFMTESHTFTEQGKGRQQFYQEVINKTMMLVNNMTFECEDVGGKAGESLSQPPRMGFRAENGQFKSAFQAAKKFVTTCKNLSFASGPSHRQKPRETTTNISNKSEGPIVILAFDEAQILIREDEVSRPSSPFSRLRHVLLSMRDCPIFSLFLSTTGKITQFTAPRKLASSSRVQSGDLWLIPPFATLGWDHLARPFPAKTALESFKFSDIGFSYQVYLGRPMFGARYFAAQQPQQPPDKSGTIIRLIRFAAEKLISHEYHPGMSLTPSQKFACLAERIPIEFLSTVHTVDSEERKQVENHMRVCITVDKTFTNMVTMNPSEPVLSDGAHLIMSSSNDFNPAQALGTCLTDFSVSRGDHGEMIGLLLLTLARDKVVGMPGSMDNQGFLGIVPFLQALFNIPRSADADSASTTTVITDILQAKPSVYRNQQAKSVSLKDAFRSVSLHFNHFVKRGQQDEYDYSTISGFFARNAALLSANSQTGVDAALPSVSGTTVCRTTTALILCQYKTDPRYTAIQPELFSIMNPVTLGLLGKGETLEVPLIRIVFALEGKTPSLCCVQTQTLDNFTSYDIWVSGLTPEVFSVIDAADEQNWTSLLNASGSWRDIYRNESNDLPTQQTLESMTPMMGDDETFWRWRKGYSSS
ncbi:hypothetical protein FISHEDRAFT_72276 [Fistulina hepatica ATCC 64428]|uniref:Uncharacterized protein n=1 Tax=Fistulina hepatica ATCC 64428 TaxID=1128425 RepID=A0A0D7AES4_9AGAR|nr:hypothetical protein FISHEDRAFT_72276 [Fistulina hepatica ATCC 64428]